MLVLRLLLASALVVAFAGCGGSDDDASAIATTASRTTAPQGIHVWKRVDPGADCQCSDGSEFSFWVREASPKKVVLYLQDGGACFSAETCANSDLYNTAVDEGPAGEGGIFEFSDRRNPFADYSFVYVPYCTGDVHVGNATKKYAPGLTVQHKGYVNGIAALDRLAATFPHATDVVVIGESAGSIAAPLYAGLASDRLPDAKITVLADGSGAYPDAKPLNKIVAGWRNRKSTPAWSFPGFFVWSGRHDPDIVFARHDYADDAEQRSWLARVGLGARSLLTRIDANETKIEDAGVNVLSYIAPGDDHTVLSDGLFYKETVNGVKLVDWVRQLIAHEPGDDVHCKKCTAEYRRE
jgi:Pectinacetylesterase